MKSTLEIMQSVVDKQIELNEKIYPDWLERNFKWSRAVWLEAAEAQDSTGWKWWKKQDIDMDNIKVELVDIFHFLISHSLQWEYNLRAANKSDSELPLAEHVTLTMHNDLVKGFNYALASRNFGTMTEVPLLPENLEKFQDGIDELPWVINKREPEAANTCFSILWSRLGLSIESLFMHYLTKNVLNTFRQNHGYKTGEYKKIWHGVEDNVFAFTLAKSIDLNSDFESNLTSELEIEYGKI